MSNEPRVVMVIDLFYPIPDGLGMQCLRLSRQLIKRGANVSILARHIDPETATHEILPGDLPIYRIGPHGPRTNRRSVQEILPFTWWLFRHRNEFDIFHVHDVRSLFIVGLLAKWSARKPLIVKVPTQGDVIRVPAKSTELTTFSRLLRKILLPPSLWYWLTKRANEWIATTQAIEDELTSVGLGHKTNRIPNGIDTEFFHPAAADEKMALREKLGLPTDATIIVSHGRLDPRKRSDVLLKALAQVRKKHPNIYLVQPGDVTEALDYKTKLEGIIAEHGLGEIVNFPGAVHNAEEYLRAADIYVLLSEGEGLSNAVLEAMSTGLAIIVSNIGGLNELILDGERGFLCHPEDVDKLTEHLCAYIENPARGREMGAAARAALAPYSLDGVAESYMDLYAKLLEQSR